MTETDPSPKEADLTAREVPLEEINDAWLRRAAKDPGWRSVTSITLQGGTNQHASHEAWLDFWTSPHLCNVREIHPGYGGFSFSHEVLSAMIKDPAVLPALVSVKMLYQKHPARLKRFSYLYIGGGEGLPAEALPLVAAAENGLLANLRPPLKALLRWMHLRRTNFKLARGEAIAASPIWERIETLVGGESFSGAGMTPIFARLAAIGKLRSLRIDRDLNYNAHERRLLDAIHDLSSLERLEILHDFSRFDCDPLIALARRGKMRLRAFRANGDINPDAMAAMAASEVFAGLEELDIGVERFDTEKTLQQANLCHVRRLRLSEVYINQNSLAALLASPIAKKLEALDLSYNKDLGDAGAKLLARCASLKSLHTLDLRFSRVKKAGAVALAESPYLDEKIREQWRKKSLKMKK